MQFHPCEGMKVQFCWIFEPDISPLGGNRLKFKVPSLSFLRAYAVLAGDA